MMRVSLAQHMPVVFASHCGDRRIAGLPWGLLKTHFSFRGNAYLNQSVQRGGGGVRKLPEPINMWRSLTQRDVVN